ncbi:MAG: tRNA 4-thiouridine(8) synthase ThiI [Saccharofermentans sp.]|jgi:thiamine biosynthesis protein ThiI|nr:tRNA 4-thiouridine(8) synthase ThiI [Mageeibacillus sp.]MCI1263386.1 tRNA 4-thiouridine(8) synthase ThiI [Saccharofermentans sp.]MCI1275723.1 tRNA 4-thiouridine(8) synthase ThiI [Saccharofermentans sp.]MCI1769055.1 tRNA 4-thiouridine(8) synthase ThiI [Mageeibacillus sp.]MCI2043983.1 tRNA 4-thiouridine(8) synthase ThiI [Mageeibacillus sp.]
MSNIILARMGEITLKGLNRGSFEIQLKGNLRYRLKKYGKLRIYQSQSRIWIEPKEEDNPYFANDESAREIMKAVTQVFGIVSVSLARKFEGGYDEVCSNTREYVASVLENNPEYKTFKVSSKRGNKSFPMNSPQICCELGGYILDKFPQLKVDVKKPDFIVNIEIRDYNYVYSGKMMAHRGLPVGTAGKGMLLLSGGIDSPVAGFMMASRGMPLDCVYFHSYPYTSDQAKQKVIDLAKIVSGFSGHINLHIVNFTQIQLDMVKNSPQDMITVTMRRIMLQIAEKLALKNDCKCLITGESLGQVASQTLEAITATNEVVKMPVLRPLIGIDKQATIDISREIGAFETSILPFEDCCTIFVARHPKTHPHPEDVTEAEKNLDINAMVESGVMGTETIEINPF